jgi:hypothetical protein
VKQVHRSASYVFGTLVQLTLVAGRRAAAGAPRPGVADL